MIHFINFLDHSPTEVQILLFSGILFICWNVENLTGLYLGYAKWNHATLNAKFIVSNIPIQLLLGFVFAKTIQWTGIHHFGLLYQLPFKNNLLFLFISTFVLLDLGEYVYHIIMHKQKRLWMFHAVHHSDSIVDVSTTVREHPGENIIRNCFTLMWVLLTGCVFWTLLLRQLIQIISNIFSHINYRLPKKLDRWIGFFFITPNLHHVHHHYEQPYTDCNYGDVLSIWDRLFGTFERLAPDKITYGLDTFMDLKQNSKFQSLIKMPFTKYRKLGSATIIDKNSAT